MAQKVFIKPVDRTPDGDRAAKGKGITLIFVDTSRFKDAIHYRLQIKEGDPGRFTFHKDTGTEYVSHLMAEERRRNSRTGLTQWVKIRKQNHFLDATVLAFAAADPEFAGGVRTVRGPRIDGEVEVPIVRSGRNWLFNYQL
jgi:phage terminase large subunit GpA-like protein